MQRRRLLPLLSAAALAGCARRVGRPPKLRVAHVPRFTMAPLYLADELGFFREAGLDVELLQVTDHVEMLPPLAAGRLDASFNVLIPAFINAVLNRARLKIVASRDVAVTGCSTGGALFGSRRAFPKGLRDLRALKGKRVAIATQTGVTAFFLDQILASAGMRPDDVNVVVMRVPEAAAALTAGRIDALSAANVDVFLDQVSAKVVRSVTLAEILPNYQYSFVIFGATLLDGDPEVGIRFLEAYLRGVREFRSGRTPRALETLAQAARADPAAFRAACRDVISADGRVDPSSVQRFVDWAVKRGFTPKEVDASQLIETRFVEEAVRRLARRTGSQR
jgi:NitT/TauT family transport system substrate-binding protein